MDDLEYIEEVGEDKRKADIETESRWECPGCGYIQYIND